MLKTVMKYLGEDGSVQRLVSLLYIFVFFFGFGFLC